MVSADKQDQKRAALLDELFGELPRPFHGRTLRPYEVALLFQVSERTVYDWARRGRIPSIRTPGGHRRYPADAISRLLLPAVQEH